MVTDQDSGKTTIELDGSRSYDPGGNIKYYDWEVVTEPFVGVPVTPAPPDIESGIPGGQSATFVVFTRALEDKAVSSIGFRLTVTDDGFPAAADSTTVVATINHGPTARITISAKLPAPRGQQLMGYDDNGNGLVDENEERYTVEGVIDAPDENGNAGSEWDIREGSLLVVDGSASFDPDGPLPANAFSWRRLYASSVDSVTESLPGDTEGQKKLSTDEDPITVGSNNSETVGLLPFEGGDFSNPYFLYYMLTVTDEHGLSANEVVKIVIRDVHADPTVVINYPESDPRASTLAARRAGIQPAGENRYVIDPEVAGEGVTLTAEGMGDGTIRTRELEHTWSGEGLKPSEDNEQGSRTTAVFTAPEGTEEGDTFVVEVEVFDPSNFAGSTSIELVVVENLAPEAVAPEDIDTPDGTNGGYPVFNPPTGVVVLTGFGFDPDQEVLDYQWEQVLNSSGSPLSVAFRGPRLALGGVNTDTARFILPEVTTGEQYVAYVQLTVTDRWGVTDSDILQIAIRDGDDDLRAVAGSFQRVQSGEFVRLQGRISSGLVSEDALSSATYQWAYVGIETHPRTENRIEISEAEEVEGFMLGEWFPNADGTYSPTAGGRIKTVNGRYPYFDAPHLYEFNSVKLVFALTVGNVPGQQEHTDAVVVTVVNDYFSGKVDGPDYCTFRSLGGPVTYPVDSDKDGIADTCALNTTRRATIARQSALDHLAIFNPEAFENALHGPPDDPVTTEIDESDSAMGTCFTAPKDFPEDTVESLEADVCGPNGLRLRRLPSPPGSIDPAKAAQFYSGPVITGPTFCINLSLGGQPLYAHDRDNDGVADVCSLGFTRREAVARQNALEAAFPADHPQYPAALAAACAALGTLDFDDSPDALAEDACAKPSTDEDKGQPLPTPG